MYIYSFVYLYPRTVGNVMILVLWATVLTVNSARPARKQTTCWFQVENNWAKRFTPRLDILSVTCRMYNINNASLVCQVCLVIRKKMLRSQIKKTPQHVVITGGLWKYDLFHTQVSFLSTSGAQQSLIMLFHLLCFVFVFFVLLLFCFCFLTSSRATG